MQAHQLHCLRAKEAEMEEAVSTEKAAREAAEAAKAAAKAELAACEKEEKEVKAKRAKAQGAGGEFKKLEEAEKKAAEALVKEETAFTEAQKSHKADEARVKALEKAEADSKAAAAKLGADQEKAAAEAAAAAEVEAAAAEVEAKAKASYEAEMGLGSENSDGPKNLQGQLSAASAAVKEHEAAAKAAKMQGDHAAKELKGAEKALADARKKGGKGEAELEKLAKEVRIIGTRLGRGASLAHGPRLLLLTPPPLPLQVAALRAKAGDGETYDEAALAKEEAGLAKASAKAAAAVEGLTNGLASFEFKYADPEKNFDRSRVVGTVASNFTMADAEGTHAVALEAVAGAKLKQVIVDNEKTAMLVLQKGKLQRRVAMVPLSKIEPTTIAAAKVAQAKALVGESRAFLATELIEFAPSVAKAMDYAFGNTIVCADAKAAKKVRARPQYWVTPLTHTPHTPHPPVPPLTPHIPRYGCARSSASAR